MMKRRALLAASAAAMGAGLAGCAGMGTGDGWVTLVDGATMKNLDGWGQLGEGNWSIVDGALQGSNGKLGYLVTPASYTDFEIRAEFWADANANSGIFIRCQDPKKVNAESSYEVNIFDKRPDPSYGTAAIVDFAKAPMPYPQAANRWNTFEIRAKGDHLVVVFNGQKTVDIRNGKHRSGPVALQSAGGTIRFRRVQIRSI
jgi:hypothetical protein